MKIFITKFVIVSFIFRNYSGNFRKIPYFFSIIVAGETPAFLHKTNLLPFKENFMKITLSCIGITKNENQNFKYKEHIDMNSFSDNSHYFNLTVESLSSCFP
jgi:hypothetical protein